MTRYPSALAFFCTSALAAAAPAAAADLPPLARLSLADLESRLAKEPQVYLRLDPDGKRLEIRSRGLTLDGIDLAAVSRLYFAPFFGGGEAPPLTSPAVWKVTRGPGDTDRDVIAPTALKPYSEDEEASEPDSSAPKKPEAPREKPTSYRVELDNGWQLFLVNERPRRGFFRRFADAVEDGWLRLRGVEPQHPPLLALVVAPGDAQRVHHLFRTGMAILVVPETSARASGN